MRRTHFSPATLASFNLGTENVHDYINAVYNTCTLGIGLENESHVWGCCVVDEYCSIVLSLSFLRWLPYFDRYLYVKIKEEIYGWVFKDQIYWSRSFNLILKVLILMKFYINENCQFMCLQMKSFISCFSCKSALKTEITLEEVYFPFLNRQPLKALQTTHTKKLFNEIGTIWGRVRER